MVNVIGVRFENAGKLYFFDPGTLWPTPGDYVVVETSRGIEFGEVVTSVKEIDEATLNSPLKPVVRIASEEDVKHAQQNKAEEKEAFEICQKKIAEHKLDMKLVAVEYTFDNSKILFYFTANGRVDFRGLVKDLAGVFKTRIELRQIGVRDEAKMLGGLGPCGRQICCGAFLGDFQPVSIKMAKEQNLSLNPTKISGVCGRLMCCLKYEQDQYEEIRRSMPKVGREVTTPDGVGVVWDLNIIRETVRVRIQKGESSEIKDYPVSELQYSAPRHQPRPAAEEAEPVAEQAAEAPEEAAEAPQDAVAEEKPRNRRERPARDKREGGEHQGRGERREKQRDGRREERRHKSQEHAEASVSVPETADAATETKPAAVPETPAAADVQPKPAVSPWKAALERAMREAAAATEENNN